jgi:RimJ/RimL family protein N-acetyltransferase
MSSAPDPVDHPIRIETERLVLDAHNADDFEALAALWADSEVVRYIGGHPSSAQESWMRLLRYRGLWPLLGYGYWAVREKSSGRFIGDLGFADFRREIEPPIIGVPEAGWVFAVWAQGRGFAGEALGAALDWLDSRPSIQRCVCLIAPDNKASIRLAQRHGFLKTNSISFKGEDTLVLSRQRHSPA